MKIILHDNYREAFMPRDILRKVADRSFLEQRSGVVVDYFEKFPIEKTVEDFDRKLDNIGPSQVVRWSETIFYVGSGEGNYTVWHLVDVDTKRKWAIDSFGGKEFLTYLDNYNLTDKKHNYHTYID